MLDTQELPMRNFMSGAGYLTKQLYVKSQEKRDWCWKKLKVMAKTSPI